MRFQSSFWDGCFQALYNWRKCFDIQYSTLGTTDIQMAWVWGYGGRNLSLSPHSLKREWDCESWCWSCLWLSCRYTCAPWWCEDRISSDAVWKNVLLAIVPCFTGMTTIAMMLVTQCCGGNLCTHRLFWGLAMLAYSSKELRYTCWNGANHLSSVVSVWRQSAACLSGCVCRAKGNCLISWSCSLPLRRWSWNLQLTQMLKMKKMFLLLLQGCFGCQKFWTLLSVHSCFFQWKWLRVFIRNWAMLAL